MINGKVSFLPEEDYNFLSEEEKNFRDKHYGAPPNSTSSTTTTTPAVSDIVPPAEGFVDTWAVPQQQQQPDMESHYYGTDN